MVFIQYSIKSTFKDVIEAISMTPYQSISQRLSETFLNNELVGPELKLAIQESKANA